MAIADGVFLLARRVMWLVGSVVRVSVRVADAVSCTPGTLFSLWGEDNTSKYEVTVAHNNGQQAVTFYGFGVVLYVRHMRQRHVRV